VERVGLGVGVPAGGECGPVGSPAVARRAASVNGRKRDGAVLIVEAGSRKGEA
jgi:hypothetical protein